MKAQSENKLTKKFVEITGIDKVPLKCDCVDESIVNGLRKPIKYNLALDKPSGCKMA